MVAILHLSTQDQPIHSEPSELYDASTARNWPREAVDQLVVGRLHGSYGWTQACLFLTRAYENFSDVTDTELQHFWTFVLPNTFIVNWWAEMLPGNPRVKKVLKDVDAVIGDTRGKGLRESTIWQRNGESD